MRRRIDSIIGELSGGPIDYDDQQYLVQQFVDHSSQSQRKFRRYFTILLAVEVPVLGLLGRDPLVRLLPTLTVLLMVLLVNSVFPKAQGPLHAVNVGLCIACCYQCWCRGVDHLWLLLPVVNMVTMVVMEKSNGDVAAGIEDMRRNTYKIKTA